jgi:hypothetical protein
MSSRNAQALAEKADALEEKLSRQQSKGGDGIWLHAAEIAEMVKTLRECADELDTLADYF